MFKGFLRAGRNTHRLEQQEAKTLGHLRSLPLSHANVSISSALVSLSGVHGSLQFVSFDFSPGIWGEEDPLKAGSPVDPTEEMGNNYYGLSYSSLEIL